MTDRQRRTGTRERIQEVALDLFTEQGYEKTSLREIAERLGVTKAALYYHFKTKEDIAASFFDGFLTDVDELLASYGDRKPATDAERREFVVRYLDVIQDRHLARALHFMEENQPTMRQLALGEKMRERMLALMQMVTDDEAPYEMKIRSRMALLSLHFTYFMGQALGADADERARVSRVIALDLMRSR